MPPRIQIGDLVEFLPGHPHEGERGLATAKLVMVRNGFQPLREFTLIGCKHGIRSCFAKQGEFRKVENR